MRSFIFHTLGRASPHAACPPPPLLRRRLADVSLLQPQDAALDIMRHLFGTPRVDDKADVVNGDGGLGHVGGQYDLDGASWRPGQGGVGVVQ